MGSGSDRATGSTHRALPGAAPMKNASILRSESGMEASCTSGTSGLRGNNASKAHDRGSQTSLGAPVL